MVVDDIMTKDVIFVSPDSLIEDVAYLLIKNRIHAVPVVNGKNKLVGIVTETDFFTKGAVTIYLPQYIDSLKKDRIAGDFSSENKEKINIFLNMKVRDIMSSPCITINEKEDVNIFFDLIKHKKLTSIPVINKSNSLVGIITLFDIIGLIDHNKI